MRISAKTFDLNAQSPNLFESTNNWFGLPDAADARTEINRIIQQGDQPSTDRVASYARTCDVSLPAARTIQPVMHSRRATGTRYDLERVLSGDPLPWSRYERQAGRGSRIVSLYVPVGGSGGLSATQIGWAPVAAVVVADLIEAAGYRAEIWAVNAAEESGVRYSVRSNLKRADQPLDLNAVSRIAHPAITRAVFFGAHLALHPAIGTGCGQCVDLQPADYNEPDAITFKHGYNATDTLSEIRRVVAKFQE